MRFNLRKNPSAATTKNLAGGDAFVESPKLELAALMLTSTLQDQYYRATDVAAARLRELIGQIDDKMFVAKAAIYRAHPGRHAFRLAPRRWRARLHGERQAVDRLVLQQGRPSPR